MKQKRVKPHKIHLPTAKTTFIFNEPILLHKAIVQFHKLHNAAASPHLSKYLKSLKRPKKYSMKTFITGINKFNRIANLSYAKRENLYNSKFSGLHYCNDLVDLWNHNNDEPIKANQIICTVPKRWWDYRLKDYFLYLVYNGKNPCKALDKLLQGPTVIDCSMFCQLSIWFAIRYMIGNRLFNQLFGGQPFYLTQVAFNRTQSLDKPYMRNPLMPFLNLIDFDKRESSVCIKSIFNHTQYQFKHPGGVDQNENCIVIGDLHNIFAPNEKLSLNLTKAEVENYLLESFNKPLDHHDREKIKAYSTHHSASVHPVFKLTYGELIYLSRLYANKKISKREWSMNSKERSHAMFNLSFDYQKFSTWITLQKKVRNNSLMLFLLLAKVDLSTNLRQIFHNHIMRRLHLNNVYNDDYS